VFSSSASSDISINKDSGSTITVSAGTVNISGSTGTHSEVERTGGTVTHDTNSGVDVVDQGEIVAIINGRRSIDLADAVNRTSAGGTVTVMNNCSFDTDISISKNLTIDTSTYGKTISGSGNFIITQPEVTVTASSSLSSRFKAPEGYKTVSASSGGNVSVHIEVATPYPTYTYSNQTAWGSFNFGTPSVTYKGRGNTTYAESATKPTSVGTYTAVFTLTDSNSNARKVNVDFVILEGGQSNE
ncbi:MAG: hypothetical protein K5634_00550, partial [Sphaerochaetaceae bacterium]|nr:hypothetical protein [Sphaerochaetaceae bacterium]